MRAVAFCVAAVALATAEQPVDVRAAVAGKYQLIDAAIAAGDFKTASRLNSEVMRLLGDAWQSTLPTPAQMLSKAEDGLATKAGDDPTHRIYFLAYLPSTAFKAGEFLKAETYGRMLLDTAGKATQTSIYGTAIFEANTILGQTAVRSGDLVTARRSLLDSLSAASQSKALVSQAGMRYDLAQELLNHGERETVVQFLEKCAVLRPQDSGKYSVWIAAIKGGANPELKPY